MVVVNVTVCNTAGNIVALVVPSLSCVNDAVDSANGKFVVEFRTLVVFVVPCARRVPLVMVRACSVEDALVACSAPCSDVLVVGFPLIEFEVKLNDCRCAVELASAEDVACFERLNSGMAVSSADRVDNGSNARHGTSPPDA